MDGKMTRITSILSDLASRQTEMSKVFKLNNGLSIPALGLGLWKSTKATGALAVTTALESGYKFFDTAAIYQNNADIGKVLGAADRKSLFIADKLHCHQVANVEKALDKNLKDLQLQYVDLYMVHWPFTPDPKAPRKFVIDFEAIRKVWRDMEKLVENGKAKSIGVSNFSTNQLKEIMKDAKIMPAVNQVEMRKSNRII